jgi:plastocyanin
MRKAVIVTIAFVVLGIGSAALAGGAGVQITSGGFNPQTTSVQAGDSVTWTNSDSVNHGVDVSGAPCKLLLAPSQSGSCTFPNAGTFSYSDTESSGHTGTVSVASNSRSVSLAASRSLNIFGDAVTLSGTVSSKAAGEQVTVVAEPAGLPAVQTTVTTTAGGAWSLVVQPRVKTTYEAQYDGASSAKVAVAIRPRISLQKVGRHQYLVVVLAARSMAGKTVNVTRWVSGRGWTTLQSVTLQKLERTPTTSVAYVTTFVRTGAKLRIFMPQTQVGADYLDGHSNFIVN